MSLRPPTPPGPASASPGVLQSQIAEPEPLRIPAWPTASKWASPARWIPTPKLPCLSRSFALRSVGFRPVFRLLFRRNPLKYKENANFFAGGAPFPSPAAPDRDGSGARIFRNRKLYYKSCHSLGRAESRRREHPPRHSRESGNPYSYPVSVGTRGPVTKDPSFPAMDSRFRGNDEGGCDDGRGEGRRLEANPPTIRLQNVSRETFRARG